AFVREAGDPAYSCSTILQCMKEASLAFWNSIGQRVYLADTGDMNAATYAVAVRISSGRMRVIRTSLIECADARKSPQARRLWGAEETLHA
ncbi:unnamed protein product, partial [Ectocarpus sp. 12 AP-2014]